MTRVKSYLSNISAVVPWCAREWLAARCSVITPLLPVRLRRLPSHTHHTTPQRLRANISRANRKKHKHSARRAVRTRRRLPRAHHLPITSAQRSICPDNNALQRGWRYAVNDPTCFRCRVGRFSEFEFRLPAGSNGPSITRIDGFGAKKMRKSLRMKAERFVRVLVSDAIMWTHCFWYLLALITKDFFLSLFFNQFNT